MYLNGSDYFILQDETLDVVLIFELSIWNS